MAYLAGENKPRICGTSTLLRTCRLIKIPIAALERASEMCKLNFDRAFLRVLVERLTLANSRLTAPDGCGLPSLVLRENDYSVSPTSFTRDGRLLDSDAGRRAARAKLWLPDIASYAGACRRSSR
jgi:hypothetical protein